MTQETIDVRFGRGMRISADFGDVSVPSDQSVKEGGDGTAPTPFQLFLASMATCAGVYARRFCETRKISTEGLAMRMVCDFADKGFRVERVTYRITLPEGFPAKYEKPLLRAVDLCTVKKHIVDAPEFELLLENGQGG